MSRFYRTGHVDVISQKFFFQFNKFNFVINVIIIYKITSLDVHVQRKNKNTNIIIISDIINSIINKLPFEIHLNGHQFCSLGTNLKKTFSLWLQSIVLDSACIEHDIAYYYSNSLVDRNEVYHILIGNSNLGKV